MLDVDGVLVTGRPRDGRHLFTDLEAELGVSPDKLRSKFFDLHWEAIVTGKEALEPRLEAVLADIAPSVGAADLIDYWFHNDSRIEEAVLTSVGRLRSSGVKVLLATNQEHRRARYLMEELGFARHVDGIVYSAAVGHRKPMPGFYTAAAIAAGAGVTEIVLVDDNLPNVEAAIKAGWRGVHWTGDKQLEEVLGWR
jgi:putative hydrolase of the HAD superfamily